jgi:putative protease
MPRISGDDLYYKLRELPVKKALMTNIGQYSILQKLNFDIYIDYNLNVFNTMAADHFSYAKRITVSAELSLPNKRHAAQVPLEAVAYGRLPLMLTENCIIKSGKSCGAANGIPTGPA